MNVLVLGAAVSGAAAATRARAKGHQVVVYDGSSDRGLRATGVEVVVGEWSPRLLDGIDLVVASPGFPERSAPIAETIASGVRLVSEIEFAVGDVKAPYAAVTGTNGKTTVTTMAAEMLERSGLRAVAAGNVGNPLSSVVADAWDAVVIEASSFQLRFIDTFAPHVAVVLNLAPDHLDWHRTFEAYGRAKARIFENLGPDDLVVYDADDEGASKLVATAPATLRPVSGTAVPAGGNGWHDGALLVEGVTFPTAATARVHRVDLAAAATVALRLGGTAAGVGAAIAAFDPGSHRREVVAQHDGVTWVNDSKATNPHAAIDAAASYDSVVLVAGGRNKGLDLDGLGLVETVRAAVLLGEAADELEPIFVRAGTATVRAVDMADAVEKAAGLAGSGDTVLLAPGCASFDMFDDYGQRGDVFRDVVRRWVEERRG